MDTSTLQVLIASVGASFALGFGTAWYVHAPDAELAAPVAAVAAVAPSPGPANADQIGQLWSGSGPAGAALPAALPQNATLDELWARALLPQDKQVGGYDAEDRLRKLAHADPVALRSLMSRYDRAQPEQTRELLKSVLSTVQNPEVIAFSTRLAGSGDMADRKFGFEILQQLAPDAVETRSLVKRTLATEQSPEVLVQALATLQSPVAEPEESDMMVAQLKTLSQHADPAVRSQSITRLGQWDKKGEGAESLVRALADGAPEVRNAAVFAIAQTGVRSDPVKLALLGLVNNAQENKDVRGSALQALERFSLSKDEYASFARARQQMRGL